MYYSENCVDMRGMVFFRVYLSLKDLTQKFDENTLATQPIRGGNVYF